MYTSLIRVCLDDNMDGSSLRIDSGSQEDPSIDWLYPPQREISFPGFFSYASHLPAFTYPQYVCSYNDRESDSCKIKCKKGEKMDPCQHSVAFGIRLSLPK